MKFDLNICIHYHTNMDIDLLELDEKMKIEIKECKEKYTLLKKEVKDKYKKLEKDKKKQEKEEQKKIRKSIPKSLKILVWDTNIGKEKGVGSCDVCKSNIDSKNFECGHIVSVKEGGDTNLENLKPICSSCNKSMGPQNLNEFKERYFAGKKSEDTKKVADDTYVNQFIRDNLGPDSSSFLSLDKIHKQYFKWLHKNHEKYYEENKFSECFGDPEGWGELKSELTKVYGNLRKDPFSHFGGNRFNGGYSGFGGNDLSQNGSDPMGLFGGFINGQEKGFGFQGIKFI